MGDVVGILKHVGGFLNLKNARASKSNTSEEVDGILRIRNKYESFSVDPESIRRAKTPYFPNVSKIRGVIFVMEGVCSATAYKEWRNTLYKAGYADSIVHKEELLLLTLKELEAVGLYFWESVSRNLVREESP